MLKMSKNSISGDYFRLFVRREGKVVLGRHYSNLWLLTGVLALTFLAIAFSNASLSYLSFKMNDPFINWLNIVRHIATYGTIVFLVLTLIVPSEVIIVPLFLIARGLGWLNMYRALILPLPTAFGVFIMRQAILDVPSDLIDAAKIDGCGNFKTFIRVVLPVVRSSLLALAIFTFVGAWNNFLWPLVACSKEEMKTLPLALSLMKTQYNTDVGLTMACAVINFLPPFLFYIFMQSKFKEGMTMGGVKG